METIFKKHGVDSKVVYDDMQRSLDASREIYWERMLSPQDKSQDLWSATTRCTKCGAWWLWGVKDNLNFVCDKCK